MPDPTTVSPMITDAVQGSPAGPEQMPWLANIPFATLIEYINLAQQNALDQQQEVFQQALATAASIIELMPADSTGTPESMRLRLSQIRDEIAELNRTASGARAAAGAPAGQESPHPVTSPPAGKELLDMLDRMNAINLRQLIRVVELAAVGAIVARALQVNTAEPGAQEQVALWTGLMETVIRDLGAWAESVH